MRKEKTRRVKLEKHEADTCPVIVGKMKISNMRSVKSKEEIRAATSNISSAQVTRCETSGNIMRLCVDLMPVLAAAREPAEEEEEEEEDNICTGPKEPESSSRDDPSVIKSVDSSIGSHLDTRAPLNPRLKLPPISQCKAAPAACCDHQKRCFTSLPPITSSEQTKSNSSNVTITGCRGDEADTGQGPHSRPWIHEPLLSKSRSPEFHLPDVSLSSLDALLQTVTQRLATKKRRGGDEGLWRYVQSGPHLVAVSERLREKSVTEDRNLANTEAVTGTSEGGCSVNRQRSLLPLLSAPKPTLIFTMTKKNLQTSNTLH